MVFRFALVLIVVSTPLIRGQGIQEQSLHPWDSGLAFVRAIQELPENPSQEPWKSHAKATVKALADMIEYKTKLAEVSDDQSMKDNVSTWENLTGIGMWSEKNGQYILNARYRFSGHGTVDLVTEDHNCITVDLTSLGDLENARVASIERLLSELEKQEKEIESKNGEIYWKLYMEYSLKDFDSSIFYLPILADASDDQSMKDNVTTLEKLVGIQVWFDKSGRYSLSARYQSDLDGKVTLVTKKGERKLVELTSLGNRENSRIASINRLHAEAVKQATVVMMKNGGDWRKIFARRYEAQEKRRHEAIRLLQGNWELTGFALDGKTIHPQKSPSKSKLVFSGENVTIINLFPFQNGDIVCLLKIDYKLDEATYGVTFIKKTSPNRNDITVKLELQGDSLKVYLDKFIYVFNRNPSKP